MPAYLAVYCAAITVSAVRSLASSFARGQSNSDRYCAVSFNTVGRRSAIRRPAELRFDGVRLHRRLDLIVLLVEGQQLSVDRLSRFLLRKIRVARDQARELPVGALDLRLLAVERRAQVTGEIVVASLRESRGSSRADRRPARSLRLTAGCA